MSLSDYKFIDLVDIDVLGGMLADLYAAVRIPSAVIDMEGNFLTGVGWQRICLDFHRKNPAAEKICIKSDTYIRDEINAGKPYAIYQCPHGLVDSCCPIIIEGRHMASVFTGQFLHAQLTDEVIERFRGQARRFGFDEKDYLGALAEVPVFSLEKHQAILAFLSQLATQIAHMGLNNLRIIEQKKVVEESEKLYRGMFQVNRSIMLLIDPASGAIVDANPAACAFYGYDHDGICRMRIGDINVLPEAELRRELDAARIAKRHHFCFTHRLADGSLREVEVYSSPIIRQGRKLLYSIIHDISDKARLDRALAESEKRLQAFLDHASIAIYLKDREHRYLQVNRKFEELTHIPRDSFIGGDDYDFFPRELAEIFQAQDNKVIARGRPLEFEETITLPDGEYTFITAKFPLLDAAGEVYAVGGICTDISHIRRMEGELFQAHKMEAIGTLAGGIAHDFNNMLAAILGYAELAKLDLPVDSQAAEYLDQVLTAGNRARDLVRQILTFSRKGQDTMRPLNPAPVIKEAVKMLNSSLPSTVTIEAEFDSECGVILANPVNVHQVLLNLCANSLHAMEKEKGTLAIRLTQVEISPGEISPGDDVSPGTFVELMVSDTGEGMAPAVIKRIFEPYFTTKGVGKGSGMGLALVMGIVKSSNGFITVKSVPGQGSTFRVLWPVLEEDAQGSDPEEDEHDLPRGDERILAVDDDENIVAMYADTLGRLGYQVTAHADSGKALTAFEDDPAAFDLIITDQTMPGLTGVELAAGGFRLRPEMPVVLCTGYSSIIPREEVAREAGIRRFLMKPVSRGRLARTVREVLDKGD